MLKPLIINRPYLFEHSPGAECLRAFVEAMDLEKWSPTVYASDYFPQSLHSSKDYVVFTHEKKYLRYYAAAVRRVLVPDLVNLPDYQWMSWGRNATKCIINDIQRGRVKPDYIHSVSFPTACHLVAQNVKRVTGLPWVMQLYDPWADNPYRVFKTKCLKKKDWEMEREAVEAADIIIHDNEYIANLWRERYGEDIAKKIRVLPLTVPLPKAKQIPIVKDNKEVITISHIGNFMLNRRALPFINAVHDLVFAHPELRNRLKVNFIGDVVEDDKRSIEEYALSDIFILHGRMTADACEPYYQDSDMFLAIDGENPENIFFPSKILKYFYFQRPILGITPIGSVLDSELSKSGHAFFANEDRKGIAEYLFHAITDYGGICNFDTDYWHQFEPESVVEKYRDIVHNMLNTIKQ